MNLEHDPFRRLIAQMILDGNVMYAHQMERFVSFSNIVFNQLIAGDIMIFLLQGEEDNKTYSVNTLN